MPTRLCLPRPCQERDQPFPWLSPWPNIIMDASPGFCLPRRLPRSLTAPWSLVCDLALVPHDATVPPGSYLPDAPPRWAGCLQASAASPFFHATALLVLSSPPLSTGASAAPHPLPGTGKVWHQGPPHLTHSSLSRFVCTLPAGALPAGRPFFLVFPLDGFCPAFVLSDLIFTLYLQKLPQVLWAYKTPALILVPKPDVCPLASVCHWPPSSPWGVLLRLHPPCDPSSSWSVTVAPAFCGQLSCLIITHLVSLLKNSSVVLHTACSLASALQAVPGHSRHLVAISGCPPRPLESSAWQIWEIWLHKLIKHSEDQQDRFLLTDLREDWFIWILLRETYSSACISRGIPWVTRSFPESQLEIRDYLPGTEFEH